MSAMSPAKAGTCSLARLSRSRSPSKSIAPQRCDAVKPVCGPCTRSRGPVKCVYTPSRRELLQQKIAELESHIDTIISSPRPDSRSSSAKTAPSEPSCSPFPLSQRCLSDIASHLYKPGGVVVLPVLAGHLNKPNASLPNSDHLLGVTEAEPLKQRKGVPHSIRNRL